MEKRWYAVYVRVGYEHQAKEALKRKIAEAGRGDLFGEILVPTEKVIDLVRGKKQTVKQRLFPGYILIEMVLNEESWHLVRSTPRLVGFVGGDSPAPIPEEEVREIIHRVETGKVQPRPRLHFTVGERVKVVDGPFRDFTGTVEAVNPQRSRVRVAINVFGRPTPVDLDSIQVEAA